MESPTVSADRVCPGASMRVLWIALVTLFTFAQPALAAPVDLSGTWVLDKQASGDLDPLLQARGASWLERQAAKGIKVTRIIRQEGDTLHVEIDSSAKDAQETLIVDGVARPETSEQGERATVTHRWEGQALVTESVVQDKSPAVRVTQTHTLSADGTTLTTRIRFVRGDEAPITVDRVYRRK